MGCTEGDTQVGVQQDPVEKAVTLQMGTLLTALNELVQTALPPGPCTITLLRTLGHTYTILTTLIKYVSSTPLAPPTVGGVQAVLRLVEQIPEPCDLCLSTVHPALLRPNHRASFPDRETG